MTFGKPKDDRSPESLSTPSFSLGGGSTGEKVEAFLGKGAKVVGTLTFTGPVELDGYVEGEINAQERLTIGEAAVINAKVTGSEILVKGTVNGDIYASRRLALKKPAKVVGNITAAALSIEEGVVFEGKSSMSSSQPLGAGVKSAEVKSLTPKPLGSEKIGVSA